MSAKTSTRESLPQIASRVERFTHLIWIVWMACLICMGSAFATPAVSNLSAAQRPGTKLVDISYDLDAPGFATVAVKVEASSDGGATWTVPVQTVSGDVGVTVPVGAGKALVWDAGVDWSGHTSTQIRFRVTADDGFSLIPGGEFTMGRTSGDTDTNTPPVAVMVSSFYMQKTETTKAQWDEVRAWGLANGYTDLPEGGGKASNHPVHTVSWWDAVKWCNARSEMENLTLCYTVGGLVMKTGTTLPDAYWIVDGCRLTKEAECEKATRGGIEGKRFPWRTDAMGVEYRQLFQSS
jgi:formylglycine-generating enzyme required for sulfatase activity